MVRPCDDDAVYQFIFRYRVSNTIERTRLLLLLFFFLNKYDFHSSSRDRLLSVYF